MAGHASPTPHDFVPAGARAPDGHRAPKAFAPPRLRASWQRSRGYGVSPERVHPVFVGEVDTDGLFYDCGSEVLRGLAATVAGEPISLMVTDADGLVLLRLCDDAAIVRSLDRVHLAPGFEFDERTAGTNGLALALADRTPSLVRAADHYCAELRGYTCAAAPVITPAGELAGSINLTTWSDAASDLLLALAKAAAVTTSALMQLRGGARPAPARSLRAAIDAWPGHGPDPCPSPVWQQAVHSARSAMASGRLVAVLGEPGAGKAAAAARGLRAVLPGHQPVRARLQSADGAEAWLARWLPVLASPGTTVVASGLRHLPAWAAQQLADAVRDVDRPVPLVVTELGFEHLPAPLAGLVSAVVEVLPLRARPADVLPLAHEFARLERGRDVVFAADARAALLSYDWPGNVAELRSVVRAAAARTDRIEAAHLPAELFTRTTRSMSRLERVERDEIVRCLTEPGVTVSAAAELLGLSRATLYRKLAYYGLELPGRSGRG